jgi:hypothetical protein
MSIKVIVEGVPREGYKETVVPNIEQAVDDDIREFNDWFRTALGNTPITGPERAIIKTYLAWKLELAKKV